MIDQSIHTPRDILLHLNNLLVRDLINHSIFNKNIKFFNKKKNGIILVRFDACHMVAGTREDESDVLSFGICEGRFDSQRIHPGSVKSQMDPTWWGQFPVPLFFS